MRYEVDLTEQQIDSILQQELDWAITALKQDLRFRQEGNGMAIYDHDPKKDCERIKEMIDAMKLTLTYYTPGGKA